MVTLSGIVRFSHELADFLGAWIGGKVFTLTGSFDTIWIIDIGLVRAIGAALIHMPIREASSALKMQAA